MEAFVDPSELMCTILYGTEHLQGSGRQGHQGCISFWYNLHCFQNELVITAPAKTIQVFGKFLESLMIGPSCQFINV